MAVLMCSVAQVSKKPLEIHIKGSPHIGKTVVTEIIRQALIAHGIEPEINCLDHDVSELNRIDLRDSRVIDHVKQRANVSIVDHNERPEKK